MANNQNQKKFWMSKQHEKKKQTFTTGELSSKIVDDVEQYAIFDVKIERLISVPIREFVTSCLILRSKDLTDEQIQAQVDILTTSFIQEIEIIINEYHYIRTNFDSIIQQAKDIEHLLYEGNSVYAVYDVDFLFRRQRFTEARSKCFSLNRDLLHMANFIAKKNVNTEKYTAISNELITLSEKIRGLIVSDDKKRKKLNKKYLKK